MNRYLAFLRGINVSGKNKIPMKELKEGFEELGFEEVKTYLNSGNVAFSSDRDDCGRFVKEIESMIKELFGLKVPVFVIQREELEEILNNAPDWWGSEDKAIYDNLIFVMAPATSIDICREIGEPKEGLEMIEVYRNAIFWSFDRKDYQKTNWWPKTASAGVKDRITIRTAGTVRKTVNL